MYSTHFVCIIYSTCILIQYPSYIQHLNRVVCVHTIIVYTQYLSYYVYTQHLLYHYVYTRHLLNNMYAYTVSSLSIWVHTQYLPTICIHTQYLYTVFTVSYVFRYTVSLPTRMYHSYLLCILVLVDCIKQYPYSWVHSISF